MPSFKRLGGKLAYHSKVFFAGKSLIKPKCNFVCGGILLLRKFPYAAAAKCQLGLIFRPVIFC